MCSRAKVRLRGKSGQALHCQCAECLAAWCKTVRASSLNVQKLRILKLFINIWKCKVLFSQKVKVLYLIGLPLVPIAVFASRAQQFCRWQKERAVNSFVLPEPQKNQSRSGFVFWWRKCRSWKWQICSRVNLILAILFHQFSINLRGWAAAHSYFISNTSINCFNFSGDSWEKNMWIITILFFYIYSFNY